MIEAFNSKLVEVVDILMCNNADIDKYMEMPTNLHPVEQNVKRVPKLCEEEDASPGPISPAKDSFHIANFVSQIPNVAS